MGSHAVPVALESIRHTDERPEPRKSLYLTRSYSALPNSTTERGKRGISTERGEMTVAQVIESFIVDHAEEHLAQVQGALRR